MKKIIKGSETHIIDSEDNMCGNCKFQPTSDETICKLFKYVPEHVRGDFSKNSGWRRLSECKNAEVKE